MKAIITSALALGLLSLASCVQQPPVIIEHTTVVRPKPTPTPKPVYRAATAESFRAVESAN